MGVVHLKQFVDDPLTARPAIVRGYAALFGVISTTLYEGGLPEVLAAGTFDAYLAKGRSPYLRLNHGPIMAIADDVVIWADEVGLAFQATRIKSTDDNAAAIRQIANGGTGCSWKHVPAQSIRNIEEASGGQILHVVRNVGLLEEISVCNSPAYADTACWLSSARLDRLKTAAYRLAPQWERSARALVGR